MIFVTRPQLPDLDKYIDYVKKIWANKWLTNHGMFVTELEKKLAIYLGVNKLLCVTNGTLALQMALNVFNFSPGDEVITTPFTFPATTNVILWANLRPVFADIDPEIFNIDPKKIEEKITPKTKAILAVHVYGNPCDVDALQSIATKYKLKLIYDAAHCFGVGYQNQSLLNFGDISILSFHATKVYHTIEGGALVAKDPEVSGKLELLRDFGIGRSAAEAVTILPGINAKMNEFQAIMGLCNLDDIDQSIARRKKIYEYYQKGLMATNLQFNKLLADKYNYSYLPVCFSRSDIRDKVCKALVDNGIHPRKYFYPLVTDSLFFKDQTFDLPNAQYVASRILCLPIYPDLLFEEIDRIVSVVKANI